MGDFMEGRDLSSYVSCHPRSKAYYVTAYQLWERLCNPYDYTMRSMRRYPRYLEIVFRVHAVFKEERT